MVGWGVRVGVGWGWEGREWTILHQVEPTSQVSRTKRTLNLHPAPQRSSDTLQNLTLELATMGDLKLVERLQQYTLAPGASKVIRANIKVSSTETGVIFGNIGEDGVLGGGVGC